MPFNIDQTGLANRVNVEISYRYNNTKIYKNQIDNSIDLGYITLPYACSTCEQDVTIIENTNRKLYKTSTIYISKSSNLITDISYDGELLVKHKSSDEKILYVYFLLKTDTSMDKTPVDNLIDFINSTSTEPIFHEFSLTSLVNNNNDKKSIFYNIDDNTKVFILSTPYKIQNYFDSSFTSTFLPIITITPPTYAVINQIKIESFRNQFRAGIEGFTEGMTNTAYCQPIDMTDPSGSIISDDPQLNIPLTGRYSPNDATNNVIRTSINFMAFVLVLGFTYLLTPIIYNDFIIGLIDYTGQGKMDRLRSIDMYTCFVFIMITFGFITVGVQKNESSNTIIGFFLGLFFIISMAIIQTKKITGTWFKEIFPTDDINYENIAFGEDLGRFIGDNLSTLKENIPLLVLIFFILFLFLFIFGVFNKGVFKPRNSFIFISLIPLNIYLTIVIASLRNKGDSAEEVK